MLAALSRRSLQFRLLLPCAANKTVFGLLGELGVPAPVELAAVAEVPAEPAPANLTTGDVLVLETPRRRCLAV